ncbi:MAG TPA: DUF1269 domain-containing protein [Candidatus Acidoferrum sp.]|nr:DUF1269 domain-containing protein [Candidatus Acidoferrum sp.]
MGDLTLILLTSSSKDGATQALDVAKALARDGWIELMDYGLIRRDKNGHIATREMDDELSEKVAAASVGVAGGIAGGIAGGPVGAAVGVAAGTLVGAGSMRVMERVVRDTLPEGLLEGLGADSSALAVVVEDRYAERLDEEFQKLGRTFQRELKQAQRDAEFEAYLQRSKDKMRSIQDDIKARLTKAQTATAAEKAKIEADVAGRRAELEALREKLEDRIKAANADLKSEIREMNFRMELAGLRARSGIAEAIDDLHRQLNRYNDELEDLIEHQIDELKGQVSDLKTKASKASAETKAAIENHLLAVERTLQKQRAALQDSFEERLGQLKLWFESLRVQSSLLHANVRDKVQATINAAQHSFAELKAQMRTRKRDDERAWKDIRAGFNKAAKDLEAAFDQAKHERA